MVSRKFKIIDELGVHMRPARLLSEEALNYKSSVKFRFNGNEYNAKSIISILGACVKSNSEIEIVCDGEDEKEAMEAVSKTLANSFAE